MQVLLENARLERELEASRATREVAARMLRTGWPHALVAASTVAAMAPQAAPPRPHAFKRQRVAAPQAPAAPEGPRAGPGMSWNGPHQVRTPCDSGSKARVCLLSYCTQVDCM